MLGKLTRFLVRVLIAAAILWAIVSVPLPLQNDDVIVLLRVPLAIFIFIVYVGKTLYDTFFFERHP
ncbi:MAG TPA: hypothetical protein VFD70_02790 [Anaerolineae bacterium]|nr:hypothetical protein [Anaerolineae bacterium]